MHILFSIHIILIVIFALKGKILLQQLVFVETRAIDFSMLTQKYPCRSDAECVFHSLFIINIWFLSVSNIDAPRFTVTIFLSSISKYERASKHNQHYERRSRKISSNVVNFSGDQERYNACKSERSRSGRLVHVSYRLRTKLRSVRSDNCKYNSFMLYFCYRYDRFRWVATHCIRNQRMNYKIQ